MLFLQLNLIGADLLAQAGDQSFGVKHRVFLQLYQRQLCFAPVGLGLVQAAAGILDLVFAFALRLAIDGFFCIGDQSPRKLGRDFRIRGRYLHSDDTFGGVIANFDVFLVDFIGFFVGWVFFQPLQRVNRRISEHRFKAHVVFEAQHGGF